MKALCVFRIWGTTHPATKHFVLEDLSHQLHHCENLRYRQITKNFYVTDYIIRELKMWRTCGSGNKDRDREERSIVQYHYLVWKDFMAPEYPAGILKFIRRMNEVYSLEKGPILVHCRCVHRVAVLRILMTPCGTDMIFVGRVERNIALIAPAVVNIMVSLWLPRKARYFFIGCVSFSSLR